jgi:hypothetical protein
VPRRNETTNQGVPGMKSAGAAILMAALAALGGCTVIERAPVE